MKVEELQGLLPHRPARRFGWKPDTPDQRDLLFQVNTRSLSKLTSTVDLRTSGFLPPSIYDQGDLGSCTANAIGAAYEYAQRKEGLDDYTPSRLFIYYGERDIEGSIPWDSGAEIRDGMIVVNKLGSPHESIWPYDVSKFAQKPPSAAYSDGQLHQSIEYRRVAVSESAVKYALSKGYPVVIGFTVYESFDNIGSDGVMPIPAQDESVLGGHAVLVVGYEKRGRYLYAICLNSWGDSWGDNGFFYMPMRWLCNTNNADDFWTLTLVER